MEKTCKTCINLCNKRGEVEGCSRHRSEVQEMIKEIDAMLEDMEEEFWEEQKRLREEEKIDRKLTVEEAVRIIQEEGYYDWEGMR